jgi:hypothetical protein
MKEKKVSDAKIQRGSQVYIQVTTQRSKDEEKKISWYDMQVRRLMDIKEIGSSLRRSLREKIF